MTSVEQTQALDEILSGIDLAKCQQCGCMRETLDQINQALPQLPEGEGAVFGAGLPGWLAKMKPIRYSCLGCDHCFAGAAQNAFTSAFPQVADSFGLSCEIQVTTGAWPPVVGEYEVLDAAAPVAVVTLASLQLPKRIAAQKPTGLAMTGKLETENIGIDKLVKNVIANPHLRYLILAGIEPAGHQSGQTLLALAENGIDANGRVIGSTGKRPVLRNVTREEVETFRRQIQVVDLIGCEDVDRITEMAQALSQHASEQPLEVIPCGCAGDTWSSSQPAAVAAPTLFVEDDNHPVKLDPAGYFVIYPMTERGVIQVEHYANDNRLLHTLESASPRALYLKIIEAGWVTEMSHAAYLGKELIKAEYALLHGISYLQDAA